jgi:2-dehydropantoate 2-reductase
MQITILGAGAMGMLYGGILSRNNQVVLIDVDQKRIEAINKEGIAITEQDGKTNTFRPEATTTCAGMEPPQLIIVFTKAMYSHSALSSIRGIIGPRTFVLSLQNGSGHEEVLLQFAPKERVVLGATQHNSSIISPAAIRHGGGGITYIGLLTKETEPLTAVAKAFEESGLKTVISDNIQKFIWNKMFLNVSASVLTAVLQVKMGYLLDNEYAQFLLERLTREAVAVANAKGLDFDYNSVIENNRKILENAREGLTSIYADIRDGRKTEVDTISGAVVRAAKQAGVPVPTHECMVALIHALEGKQQ